MSRAVTLHPANGLAGLLSTLQPGPSAPPVDLEAIRAQGFADGFAAGEAAAAAGVAPLRLHLAEAAAALNEACRIDPDSLRPVLMALVRQVAEAVLAAELQRGAAALEPLMTTALAALRPGDAATLHAHPDTLAMLRAHAPDLHLAPDPAMPPGSFAVSGTDFVIDAGLSGRLDAVLASLA
jgi:flagellar biosynthesis/type III secretory pathway protein FliH